MITEDYVSFEIAKPLKEKGFPLPSTNFKDWLCCMYDENGDIKWGCYHPDWYARVTHQMAMKWLRDKYCLHFVIQPMMSMPSCELKWTADTYDTSIFYKELYEFECVASTKLCDSPEQAVEATIKYCLENLI